MKISIRKTTWEIFIPSHPLRKMGFPIFDPDEDAALDLFTPTGSTDLILQSSDPIETRKLFVMEKVLRERSPMICT